MEFEKLGAFYLGKEYDVGSGRLLDQHILYDARDLTTHAVCLGMTGSGKTGLCIDLLEEAAIDRVPALIIDPKGDITNLLLQFPDLLPSDFRPWINPGDARRKGMSLDEYAKSQAELWKTGLAKWGQDGSRIRALQESASFSILTPGSEAGLPVSVLQSFRVPPKADWEGQVEELRDRIEGTVSALLGLIGVEADPVRSREHILLSHLFEHFWKSRADLDFPKLILAIQRPPISRVGVFDLDTFFPPKERFELAMSLNNIIAAPSFASWLKGQPLDIQNLLSTPEGKPRHSVFYIAHLSDSERNFFVAILLNQLIGWMRAQPGTTSLRALVYMDEIFGFLPPVANPPSKKPMLTLLKQARAFGVGMVLATQNPVDLDYKGLTNAGTWFIGRLQTERDKERILDGLVSASATSGREMDRRELANIISGLGSRVFLMHNVHDDAPITFQTRWAMSYLRGPMTRSQISDLTKSRLDLAELPTSYESVADSRPAETSTVPTQADQFAQSPPALSPDLRQLYLPPEKSADEARLDLQATGAALLNKADPVLLYQPRVFAVGSVSFVDRRKKVEETEELSLIVEAAEDKSRIDWAEAVEVKVEPVPEPSPGARFSELPAVLNEKRELKKLEKDLLEYLYRNRRLFLLFNPKLEAYSMPGEGKSEFSMRLIQMSRELRDDEVDRLTESYEKKLSRLQSRISQAEAVLEKKTATQQMRKGELLVSMGETVLGLFLGRRSIRSASSSLTKYRMQKTAKLSAEESARKIELLRQEASELQEELKERTAEISDRWEDAVAELEEVAIAPRRTDVRLDLLCAGWEPHWLFQEQGPAGITRNRLVSALQLT